VAVEADVELVVALGEVELAGIGSVAVVLGLKANAVVTGSDHVLVATERLVVTVLVASLDREGTVREAGVGGVCFLEAVQPPVAEKRDICHHGEFVRALVDINGVDQLWDRIFLLGSFFSSLEISEGISRPGVLRHHTGRKRVGEGGEDTTISPVEVEVVGLLSIWSNHLSHPFEELGLALETTSLDLESEDESPDETEDELQVVVGDVLGSDADELDTLLLDKLERQRSVLEQLRTDLGILVVLASNILARNNLQQVDQEKSVVEIIF